MLAKTETITVKQIAAGIRKSAAYETAAAALQKAAETHGATVEATRSAIALNSDRRNAANVNACAAAEAKAEQSLRLCRDKVQPLRAAHGEKIAAALLEPRQAAARRILEILADMAPELRVLHETMVEIEAYGIQSVRMPPIDLSHVAHVALRIAGTAVPAGED